MRQTVLSVSLVISSCRSSVAGSRGRQHWTSSSTCSPIAAA
jgi:hypothetical protein